MDKTEHNYSKKVIEPTCTEHGYTIYTCPDCGKEYIADLTEHKNHSYTETVIAPTCTEMGYTIFTCVIAAIPTKATTRIKFLTITKDSNRADLYRNRIYNFRLRGLRRHG